AQDESTGHEQDASGGSREAESESRPARRQEQADEESRRGECDERRKAAPFSKGSRRGRGVHAGAPSIIRPILGGYPSRGRMMAGRTLSQIMIAAPGID